MPDALDIFLRRLAAGLSALAPAVLLTGCGGSGHHPSAQAGTPRMVQCVKLAGLAPVRMATRFETNGRYFRVVDGTQPTGVYQLKDGLVMGVFRNASQAKMVSEMAMPTGITTSIQTADVVVRLTQNLSESRYLTATTTVFSCGNSHPPS